MLISDGVVSLSAQLHMWPLPQNLMQTAIVAGHPAADLQQAAVRPAHSVHRDHPAHWL